MLIDRNPVLSYILTGGIGMSDGVKIAVLAVVSVMLAVLTRRSLKSVRSHGLFRLLAWMAFISLILVNVDYWFDEPFCPRQIASWLLLTVCTATVIYGTISLRLGKPNERRADPSLIGIERTTQLVRTGAYRYIRHPMYSSFLFGAWGVFLKHCSLLSGLLAVFTTLLAVVTAKKEESENVDYFGDEYRDYMRRTKMFIPLVY